MFLKILAGLVLLGVLVVVHEFGHFVVAKLFRIGVPVFSVGMGPRLFGVRWRGTDYRVSALPIGGYVRMAGADPFGEEDPDSWVDPSEDFAKKPIWQRLLVMLAGPGFNLALPFVLFTAVLMLGEPQPDATIGMVLPGSVAEQVGLFPEDRVVAIDGKPIGLWEELVEPFMTSTRTSVSMAVDRDGRRFDLVFPLSSVPRDEAGVLDADTIGFKSFRVSTVIGVDDPKSPAGRAGLKTGDHVVAVDGGVVETWSALVAELSVGESHRVAVERTNANGEVEKSEKTLLSDASWSPPAGGSLDDRWGLASSMLFVGLVTDDSAAEAAGVEVGDRVVAIDGHPVRTWFEIVDLVSETAEGTSPDKHPRALQLSLVRDGQLLDLEFHPRMKTEITGGQVRHRPLMGVSHWEGSFVPGPEVRKYYSLFEAFPRAASESAALFEATVNILGSLIIGDAPPQDTLGGPLKMFHMAGESVENGVFWFMRLVGTISISLGIFNLLPVPVLDGGQILFFTIEGLRGRPLSLAVREKLQMAGILVLVALMLMVTVFDVNDWIGGR